MPWSRDPSVVHRRGHDYWRTWFIDECEQAKLFGVTGKHVDLLSLSGKGVVPYRPGTHLFLEDAPWFPHTGQRFHRVCGPYEVEAVLVRPAGAIPVHRVNGAVIVYKDPRADSGPWHDGSRRRRVGGETLRFRQIASEYDYFPYRFRIVPTAGCGAEEVLHPVSGHCWLCV